MTSRWICKISAAMESVSKPGSRQRSARGVPMHLADAVDPALILRVKSHQSLISRSRVVVRLIADGRPAEVAGVAVAEDPHDHVAEPPGDGGYRRRIRLGEREINDVRAAADGNGDRLGSRPDAPAALHRLPEVLGVTQPFEARSQLVLPVP